MSNHLNKLETLIVRLGIFLIFLFTFGEYVAGKVMPVIGKLWQAGP